ncbi:Valine--tRNA ligase, partial [Araneus ventricosus]
MFFKLTKCFRPKASFYTLNKSYLQFYPGSNYCLSHVAKYTEVKYPLKKDLSGPYPVAYEPKEVEKEWYEYWERNGLFYEEARCDHGARNQRPEFCLVLPPPNVTGNLHIGHTLTVTIQDCISRWRRMRGEKVIWIPGFDHGGIATQTIVEKKLLKEKNITKQELGKEKFLIEINEWKTVTQKNIEVQLKLLGASLDFRKSLFTLDSNSSKAVAKVFIDLFEDNLIYRKEKLVNWSSQIRSVISDIESVKLLKMSMNYDTASVSEVEDGTTQESLYSEVSKLRLKDAVIYYQGLLAQNNLISSESSASISHEAMLMGEEIFQNTLDILAEKIIVSDEELIHENERCQEVLFEKVEGDVSSDEYEPEEKKRYVEYISLDYKIKVVNIARAHPTWNLQSLQKNGCSHLKKMEYLSKWEEEIKKEGNLFDKYSILDSWTYDRFVEARENYQQVTTRNLQQWALAAAGQFAEFEFKASESWVKKFKNKHGIRQRKVTKFVSKRETATIKETLASAATFRKQALKLIPNFNKDYVINTDQTGCQYQSNYNRTLAVKGSKTIFVKQNDMNKVTHSYTAQYSLSLSGKVLPKVDHLEIPQKKKVRIPGLKDPVELGLMDYFYYPVENSDEKILMATTRLETMLGDSAVAVNPTDTRYTHLVGKCVKHPYTGGNLPIIFDENVNKDFGTGAMKVTPAHDNKDYELGIKHNLKIFDILADDGTINMDIENFQGKHRLVVRSLLRKSLSEKGLYKEAKSHSMTVPFCSRSGDIVEPRLKDQWYLDCTEMGQKAVEAVKNQSLRFIPDHHEKVWFEWFRHLRDWCISRQLWWGHQIPAYKIHHNSNKLEKDLWIAATCEKEAIEKASKKYDLDPKSIKAVQDTDVLDTWFSSALYPLTALGWPSQEEYFKKYYPLNLMETGFDILFFWVARMVMLGEHITGKLPFTEVLLHGMVCDSHGRKMTKSLGNTVDPLDVINGVSLESLLQRVKDSQDSLTPEEVKLLLNANKQNFPNGIPECGTDGLRFSLLTHDIQNQRISIDVKSIRICRHFCNKTWQGFRLFTRAIENCSRESLTPLSTDEVLNLKESDVDRWILSRLAGLVVVSNAHFEKYEFHLTANAVRQFWVQNFCDVYIEYAKPALLESEERRLFICRVLLTCIETFLKIISPMMPFLSEELYQRLLSLANIESYPSVSLAKYPTPDQYSGWRNTMLEADVHTVTELIGVARSLKSKHGATQMRPA